MDATWRTGWTRPTDIAEGEELAAAYYDSLDAAEKVVATDVQEGATE